MSQRSSLKFFERVDRGHAQFKCKCIHCGLHFITCSWYHDWAEQVGKVTCPECGKKGNVLVLAKEIVDMQIYEAVPGAEMSDRQLRQNMKTMLTMMGERGLIDFTKSPLGECLDDRDEESKKSK